METHPVQEPGIRVVFDVDLHVDEHAASEQSSALTKSSPCERYDCAETCETEPLYFNEPTEQPAQESAKTLPL